MKCIILALHAAVLSASAEIIVTGPESLPFLKEYVQAMPIRHEGQMNSLEELQIIKQKIDANQEPWKTYYTNLTKSAYSKIDIVPRPLTETAGASSTLIGDSYGVYNQTLMWYFTGNAVYAENARAILNAWSAQLQRINDSNWYLTAGWAGSILAPAAELLRATYPAWPASEIAQVQGMFNRAFLPILTNRKAYGNRHLSVCNGLLAIGIFNNDRAAIYKGLHHWISYIPCFYYLSSDGPAPIRADYWATEPSLAEYWQMHADLFPTQGSSSDWLYAPAYPFTGKTDDHTMMDSYTVAQQWHMASPKNSIPNPVPAYVDGLCAETFRDLGHSEFAFAATINVAEIALHQGIDLYSAYAPRFAAFAELQASFRLSNPLPPALANSGVLNSGDGLIETYEIAYHRLHDCLGVSLPYVEQLLPTVRLARWYRIGAPAGIFATGLWSQQHFHIGWESLLHQGLPPHNLFPMQGLVAYYGFEQSPEDSSSYGNDAVARSGFAYSGTAAENSYSGSFDGGGARLVAADSNSLRITGNLTVAAWVRTGTFASQPNLIAKSFNSGYRLRLTTSGVLNLILGNGTSTKSHTGAAAVPSGAWAHVAATVSFSGSTAVVRFYIDGALDVERTATMSSITAGTGALVLGARTDQASTTESLSGLLDQVTIYNRALSAGEIAALAR